VEGGAEGTDGLESENKGFGAADAGDIGFKGATVEDTGDVDGLEAEGTALGPVDAEGG
jgi:hypothetical protein